MSLGIHQLGTTVSALTMCPMRVWEFRTSDCQNVMPRIYHLLGIKKLVYGTQVQVASASIKVIKCNKSERRRGKIIGCFQRGKE